MDGVTQVQARISEIQARFIITRSRRPRPATGRRAAVRRRAGRHRRGTDTRSAARPATASETAVVAEAQKYLGVPYLWGGTDPAKGLDCSGFTQLVFGNLGIDLPRVSSQQATAGRAGRLAGRRPARRPGLLRLLLVARRDRPRRHLHRQRQDDRRAAARRVGQGPGRRQPDGHPPGPPRADAAADVGTSGSAPWPACRTPTCSAARPAGTASTRRCWPPSRRRSPASTPPPSRPPAPRASCSSCRRPPQGLGREPARPDSAIDGAARYLSSLTKQFGSTDLALAAYNAGPGDGQPLRRHPALRRDPELRAHRDEKAEAYR